MESAQAERPCSCRFIAAPPWRGMTFHKARSSVPSVGTQQRAPRDSSTSESVGPVGHHRVEVLQSKQGRRLGAEPERQLFLGLVLVHPRDRVVVGGAGFLSLAEALAGHGQEEPQGGVLL